MKFLNSSTALAAIALTCLLLAACGGGISGTGDGNMVTGIANNSGYGNNMANAPDEVEDLSASLHILPGQLMLPLSEQLTRKPDDQVIQPAAIPNILMPIQTPLRTLTLEGIATQVDFVLIEQAMSDALSRCTIEQTCTSLPGTISTVYSEAIAFYEDTLTMPLGATRSASIGTLFTYTDFRYQPEISGIFDERIEYKRGDGSHVVVQWTDSENAVSLFIENNTSASYTLFETNNANRRMTVRYNDKVNTGIFQSVLQPAPNIAALGTAIATLIEADVQTPMAQHYVRAIVDEKGSTLFSQHPTDQNTPSYRKILTPDGSTLIVDTCIRRTADVINCAEWQSEFAIDLPSAEASIHQFNTFEALFGNYTATLTDRVFETDDLPATVARYILSAGQRLASPPLASILCGGQRLHGIPRTFCWQPQPASNPVALFEESIHTDRVIYQRLP